jgi:uncharacterized protein YodC (DUF2158 family)
MDWKIGDIVRCRAGGPNMVIRGKSCDGVCCEWVDGQRKYQSGTFASTSLEIPELLESITI